MVQSPFIKTKADGLCLTAKRLIRIVPAVIIVITHIIFLDTRPSRTGNLWTTSLDRRKGTVNKFDVIYSNISPEVSTTGT